MGDGWSVGARAQRSGCDPSARVTWSIDRSLRRLGFGRTKAILRPLRGCGVRVRTRGFARRRAPARGSQKLARRRLHHCGSARGAQQGSRPSSRSPGHRRQSMMLRRPEVRRRASHRPVAHHRWVVVETGRELHTLPADHHAVIRGRYRLFDRPVDPSRKRPTSPASLRWADRVEQSVRRVRAACRHRRWPPHRGGKSPSERPSDVVPGSDRGPAAARRHDESGHGPTTR